MAPWLLILSLVTGGVASNVHLANAGAEGAVRRAVVGARDRLRRPECQRVLTDFQDAEGRPLVDVLRALDLSASVYLVDRVHFLDGDGAKACEGNEGVMAFTSPGSPIVRVCSTRFVDRYPTMSVIADVVMIHEMLHTLGLGENPPTSAAITSQVLKRCGH
jgi:hypothetical protein